MDNRRNFQYNFDRRGESGEIDQYAEEGQHRSDASNMASRQFITTSQAHQQTMQGQQYIQQQQQYIHPHQHINQQHPQGYVPQEQYQQQLQPPQQQNQQVILPPPQQYQQQQPPPPPAQQNQNLQQIQRQPQLTTPAIINVRKNVILIGNPGVGKSTLLNCLMQERMPNINSLFKSGISIGSGLTNCLYERNVNGIHYLDTPGLADVSMRKQAASSLTQALTRGGLYQLLFVITLEAGRVRPADVACMRLILECAPEVKFYGVIINKLSRSVHNKMIAETSEELNVIEAQISVNKEGCEPRFFWTLCLPTYSDLEDEDDKTIQISDLSSFLESISPVEITPEKVKPIPEDDTFEKYAKELEKEIMGLTHDQEKLSLRMEEERIRCEKETERILSTGKEEHEKEMQRLQKECENKEREMKEEMRRLEAEKQNEEKLLQVERKVNLSMVEMEQKHKMKIDQLQQQLQLGRSLLEEREKDFNRKLQMMEAKKKSRNPFKAILSFVSSVFTPHDRREETSYEGGFSTINYDQTPQASGPSFRKKPEKEHERFRH